MFAYLTAVLVFAAIVVFGRWFSRHHLPEKQRMREQAALPPAPPAPLVLKSPETRVAILNAKVVDMSRAGWRVVTMHGEQAVMACGHRPNHILHLLLSIVTVGLWLPIWIIIGCTTKERQRLMVVDPYGRILIS